MHVRDAACEGRGPGKKQNQTTFTMKTVIRALLVSLPLLAGPGVLGWAAPLGNISQMADTTGVGGRRYNYEAVTRAAATNGESKPRLIKNTDRYSRLYLYGDFMSSKAKLTGYGESREVDNPTNLVCKGFGIGYLWGIPCSYHTPVFIEVGANASFLFHKFVGVIDFDIDRSGNFDIYNTADCKYFLMNASMPLHVSYRFSLAQDKVQIKPYVGPKFRLNCIFMEKIGDGDWDFLIGDTPARLCQLCLNAGVGFTFRAASLRGLADRGRPNLLQ